MSGLLSTLNKRSQDPPVLKVIQTWGGRPILDIAKQVRNNISKIGKECFVEFLRENEVEQNKQIAELIQSRVDIGIALTEAWETLAKRMWNKAN